MRVHPLAVLFTSLLSLAVAADAVPLVAHVTGAVDGEGTPVVHGAGVSVTAAGLTAAAGPDGAPALAVSGREQWLRVGGEPIDRLSAAFTVTMRLRLDTIPDGDARWNILFAKGFGERAHRDPGWKLSLTDRGHCFVHGLSVGFHHQEFGGGSKLSTGQWTDIAYVFKRGDAIRVYRDGKQVGSRNAPHAFLPMTGAVQCGGGGWDGAIASVRIYAAALTPEQLAQERTGALATRALQQDELPEPGYPVRFRLARADEASPQAPSYGPIKRFAARRDGPEAIDWPQIRIETARGAIPLFVDGSQQWSELPYLSGRSASSWRQQSHDATLPPYGHWVRALSWRWGQSHVYTDDTTARSGPTDYELWTFPVELHPTAGQALGRVQVALGGETVYDRTWPAETTSLTLLLPANPVDTTYQVTIGTRKPVAIAVGLEAVDPNDPVERHRQVDAVTADGHVRLRTPPSRFIDDDAWAEDLALTLDAIPERPAVTLPTGIDRHFVTNVPRSGVTVFTATMRHGMSAGHSFGTAGHIPRFRGSDAEYAAHCAELGFDVVYQGGDENMLWNAKDPWRLERHQAALAAAGIASGLHPSSHWSTVGPETSGIHVYAAGLPAANRPVLRSLALLAQRSSQAGNFVGMIVGGDNAAYVPFWHWAPPHYNRPWITAWNSWNRGRFAHPRADWPTPQTYGGRSREFLDYIRAFDATYAVFGRMATTVQSVDRTLHLTTGSFGSAPGVVSGGGYPIGSVPNQELHANVPVQLAYDWSETGASKPLHLVQLIDRLRSDDPAKPTWAVVDDFRLFFGRGPRERAWAFALSRGLHAIGSPFLPHVTGDVAAWDEPRRQRMQGTIDAYRDLHQWVKAFGGAYAQMRSTAPLGILYVHEQSVLRECAVDDPKGPHEGKTTEALLIAHAAGIPARIVTTAELQRGLTTDIAALFLVGLPRLDDTWVWHEGLESALESFVARGGVLVRDDESVSPVPAIALEQPVRSYVKQNNVDQTPTILARNTAIIAALRAALPDLGAAPVAAVEPLHTWVAPSVAGDCLYVTVTNWQPELDDENKTMNLSQRSLARTAALRWDTDRPIYDLFAAQRVEAPAADFSDRDVRIFCLPPRPVPTPRATMATGADGFATVSVDCGGMTGIPVAIALSGPGGDTTVHGASGVPIRLPLSGADAGAWTLTITELCARQQTTVQHTVRPTTTAHPQATPHGARSQAWLARTQSVVIALTSEQAEDPAVSAFARDLATQLTKRGRETRVVTLEPETVVTGLQPFRALQPYPRWVTIEEDLVLLGTPADNVLIRDQFRGALLPESTRSGETSAHITIAPFVAGQQVLNLVGNDLAAWQMAWARVH